MKKKEIKNCWEFMNCGREPGGCKVGEFGVCPTATSEQFDNVNGGVNGGRFCWFVSKTLCKGQVQGSFAQKLKNCIECPFYLQVEKEEGRYLILSDDDL